MHEADRPFTFTVADSIAIFNFRVDSTTACNMRFRHGMPWCSMAWYGAAWCSRSVMHYDQDVAILGAEGYTIYDCECAQCTDERSQLLAGYNTSSVLKYRVSATSREHVHNVDRLLDRVE